MPCATILDIIQKTFIQSLLDSVTWFLRVLHNLGMNLYPAQSLSFPGFSRTKFGFQDFQGFFRTKIEIHGFPGFPGGVRTLLFYI